jgi:peptidoglycan glycosyltransferase
MSYLVISGGLFIGGAYAAYRSFDHVQRRVDVWLDPWTRASGAGYQIVQATFAFSWGGLAGTGIGLGDPGRVPAAETDFIFAAIAEELGLVGATAVLAAYLLMVGTGLRIAMRAEGGFEKLLATGLTTIIGVQSFLIIGGVTRLVPLTGVTLPFVSYGGSSLVANYVLLALLLRISHDNARRSGEVASKPARVPWKVKRAAKRTRQDAHRDEALTALDDTQQHPAVPAGAPSGDEGEPG